MTVHINQSLWLPETEYFPSAQKKTRLEAANAVASVALPVAAGPFTTPGSAFTTATRTSTSVECTITTPISTFTSAYGLFTPPFGTRATGCCKRTSTLRRRAEGSGKPAAACCKRTSTLRRRTKGSGKPAAACCKGNTVPVAAPKRDPFTHQRRAGPAGEAQTCLSLSGPENGEQVIIDRQMSHS